MEDLLEKIKETSTVFNIDENFLKNMLADVELDQMFERSLNEEHIDVDFIRQSAPWLQLEDETDDTYSLFKRYINLSITQWEISTILHEDEMANLEIVESLCEIYRWKSRRFSYISYLEWLRRRKDELEQLDSIDKFRVQQNELFRNTTLAASVLVTKIGERINEFDPSEITLGNLPKLISAAETLIEVSVDAQSRVLALTQLISLHQDELEIASVQDHIALAQAQTMKAENG